MKLMKIVSVLMALILFCETVFAAVPEISKINASYTSVALDKGINSRFTENNLKFKFFKLTRKWLLKSIYNRARFFQFKTTINDSFDDLQKKDKRRLNLPSEISISNEFRLFLKRQWKQTKGTVTEEKTINTTKTAFLHRNRDYFFKRILRKIIFCYFCLLILFFAMFGKEANASRFIQDNSGQTKIIVEQYTKGKENNFPVEINGHLYQMHDNTLNGISAKVLKKNGEEISFKNINIKTHELKNKNNLSKDIIYPGQILSFGNKANEILEKDETVSETKNILNQFQKLFEWKHSDYVNAFAVPGRTLPYETLLCAFAGMGAEALGFNDVARKQESYKIKLFDINETKGADYRIKMPFDGQVKVLCSNLKFKKGDSLFEITKSENQFIDENMDLLSQYEIEKDEFEKTKLLYSSGELGEFDFKRKEKQLVLLETEVNCKREQSCLVLKAPFAGELCAFREGYLNSGDEISILINSAEKRVNIILSDSAADTIKSGFHFYFYMGEQKFEVRNYFINENILTLDLEVKDKKFMKNYAYLVFDIPGQMKPLPENMLVAKTLTLKYLNKEQVRAPYDGIVEKIMVHECGVVENKSELISFRNNKIKKQTQKLAEYNDFLQKTMRLINERKPDKEKKTKLERDLLREKTETERYLKICNRKLQKSILRNPLPCSGIITMQKNMFQGSLVKKGDLLFEVENHEYLIAEFVIDRQYSSEYKRGDSLIFFDEGENVLFPAKIKDFTLSSSGLTVRAVIKNINGLLKKDKKLIVFLPTNQNFLLENPKTIEEILKVEKKFDIKKSGLFFSPVFILSIRRKNKTQSATKKTSWFYKGLLLFFVGLMGCSSASKKILPAKEMRNSCSYDEISASAEQITVTKDNLNQILEKRNGAVNIAAYEYSLAEDRCAEFFASFFKVNLIAGADKNGSLSYSSGLTRKKGDNVVSANVIGFDGAFGFSLFLLDEISKRISGEKKLKDEIAHKTKLAAYYNYKEKLIRKKTEAYRLFIGIKKDEFEIQKLGKLIDLALISYEKEKRLYDAGFIDYSQFVQNEKNLSNLRQRLNAVKACAGINYEEMCRFLNISDAKFSFSNNNQSYEKGKEILNQNQSKIINAVWENSFCLKADKIIADIQAKTATGIEKGLLPDIDLMLACSSKDFGDRAFDLLEETEKGFFVSMALTRSFGKRKTIQKRKGSTRAAIANAEFLATKCNLKAEVKKDLINLKKLCCDYEMTKKITEKVTQELIQMMSLIEERVLTKKESRIIYVKDFLIEEQNRLDLIGMEIEILIKKFELFCPDLFLSENIKIKSQKKLCAEKKFLAFAFLFLCIVGFFNAPKLYAAAFSGQERNVERVIKGADTLQSFKVMDQMSDYSRITELYKIVQNEHTEKVKRIWALVQLYECQAINELLDFMLSTETNEEVFFAAKLIVDLVQKNNIKLFQMDDLKAAAFIDRIIEFNNNIFYLFSVHQIDLLVAEKGGKVLEALPLFYNQQTQALFKDRLICYRLTGYLKERNLNYAEKSWKFLQKIFCKLGVINIELFRKEYFLGELLKNNGFHVSAILKNENLTLYKKICPEKKLQKISYVPVIEKREVAPNALCEYINKYYEGRENVEFLSLLSLDFKRIFLSELLNSGNKSIWEKSEKVFLNGKIPEVLRLYDELTGDAKKRAVSLIVNNKVILQEQAWRDFTGNEEYQLRVLLQDIAESKKEEKARLKYFKLYLNAFSDYYLLKFNKDQATDKFGLQESVEAKSYLSKRLEVLKSKIFIEEAIAKTRLQIYRGFSAKIRMKAKLKMLDLIGKKEMLQHGFVPFFPENNSLRWHDFLLLTGGLIIAGAVLSRYWFKKRNGLKILNKPILNKFAQMNLPEWENIYKKAYKWRNYFFVVLGLRFLSTIIFTCVMIGIEMQNLFSNLLVFWIGMVVLEQVLDYVAEPIRERLGAVWLDEFCSYLDVEVNKYKSIRGIDRKLMKDLYGKSFMLSTPYAWGRLSSLYIWESVMSPVAIMFVLPFISIWFFLGYLGVMVFVSYVFRKSLKEDNSLGRYNEAKELSKMNWVRMSKLRDNLGIKKDKLKDWNGSVEKHIKILIAKKRAYVAKLKFLAIIFPGTGALMGLPLSTLALSRGLQPFYSISEYTMALSRAFAAEEKIYAFAEEVRGFNAALEKEKTVLSFPAFKKYKTLRLEKFSVKVGRPAEKDIDERRLILRKTNLQFNFGETVFIEGLSGAGKTTFLNAFSQRDVTQIAEGNIFVKVERADGSLTEKSIKGNTDLFHYYSMEGLADIFTFDELLSLIDGETQKRRFLDYVSEHLNINLNNVDAYDFSDGQMARLMIAIILSATDAPILVLDQPLSWLDKVSEETWIKLLKEAAVETNKLIIAAAPQSSRKKEHYDREFVLMNGHLIEVSNEVERPDDFISILDLFLKEFELQFSGLVGVSENLEVGNSLSSERIVFPAEKLFKGNEKSVVFKYLLPQVLTKYFPFEKFAYLAKEKDHFSDYIRRQNAAEIFVKYREVLQKETFNSEKESAVEFEKKMESVFIEIANKGIWTFSSPPQKMWKNLQTLFYAFELFLDHTDLCSSVFFELDEALNNMYFAAQMQAGLMRKDLIKTKKDKDINLFFSDAVKKTDTYILMIKPFMEYLKTGGFRLIINTNAEKADFSCCLKEESAEIRTDGILYLISKKSSIAIVQGYLLIEILSTFIATGNTMPLKSFVEVSEKEEGVFYLSKDVLRKLQKVFISSPKSEFFRIAA